YLPAIVSRTPTDVSFFSSRRRHTRSKRDWSSDVCSSDLGLQPQVLAVGPVGGVVGKALGLDGAGDLAALQDGDEEAGHDHRDVRSEERRVGKEGISRSGRGQ